MISIQTAIIIAIVPGIIFVMAAYYAGFHEEASPDFGNESCC
jgi:hypothetical protein